MDKKDILRSNLIGNIILSILNYLGVLFVSLWAYASPGARDINTYISFFFIIFVIHSFFILAMYLEYKAYKTRKNSYLVLPFIMTFVFILLPPVGNIIKLILLISLSILIKKTPEENNEIVDNNQTDQNNDIN